MTKKQLIFTSIWMVALLPVLIAWSMAYFSQQLQLDTKNKGELVNGGLKVPATLSTQLAGKWGLVVISEQCLQDCQQQVYRMQQLHKSLGQHYDRLQPIWLTSQPTDIDLDIDYTQVQAMSEPALLDWFSSHQLRWQDQSIWLIDPNGSLVMRFPPELTGKAMLGDIKWLFKVSRIG